MTQSAPDRAMIRDMLAPGSICHNPMAGRLASANTCFSLFDRNIVVLVSMDIEGSCWVFR
jgi:hypothetical protein